MTQLSVEQDKRLNSLAETVSAAAVYLGQVDECLSDGYQTARQVLSHLVFWHREYVSIAKFLVEGRQSVLRKETYPQLHAAAACEFENISMADMAHLLLEYQAKLDEVLRRLPDWEIMYPVKYGGRQKSVTGRLPEIESHIGHHLKRLQRAERRGEVWYQVYFPSQSE
jgi:hypothetical protein